MATLIGISVDLKMIRIKWNSLDAFFHAQISNSIQLDRCKQSIS